MRSILPIVFVVAAFSRGIPAFLPFPAFSRPSPTVRQQEHPRAFRTLLSSGFGIATNYTWKEEAFEIDVTVKVPPETRAKDILFSATARSIDLRLKAADGSEQILLDASRKLRGRVNLDGTYWVISDSEDDSKNREVTLTIEKIIRTPKDDFEIIEYDWKGVYADDADDVSERKYDEPEVLDVREYAQSLGVDIDNINMSMVDKTMFSSGLNLTQSSLDELTKAGYINEVTRQADGKEYTVDDKGERVPFSQLGEKIGEDELEGTTSAATPKIPFLDTDSPWQKSVPVQVDKEKNKTYVHQQVRNFTRAAFAQDQIKDQDEETLDPKDASDPIDMLTVKKMKEILKSQGLKVSGTKKELQDRLRSQVNSLLQGKQEE